MVGPILYTKPEPTLIPKTKKKKNDVFQNLSYTPQDILL